MTSSRGHRSGYAGEVAQVADQDGSAHGYAAAAGRRAGEDLLAGMRADIGFQQRASEAVLQPDFADQGKGW